MYGKKLSPSWQNELVVASKLLRAARLMTKCEDFTLQRELALLCRQCSLAKKSSSKGTLTGFASTKKKERSGKGGNKKPFYY